MSRQVLTHDQIETLVAAGHPVLYNGMLITSVDDIPTDEQINAIYDDFNPFQDNENALGVLGYPIVGLPEDGETIVFNEDEKQWEFGTAGGGGSSVGGTDRQIQFNDDGELGGAAGFKYFDSTESMMVHMQAQAVGRGSLWLREAGASDTVPSWEGYNAVLALHTKDDLHMWGLFYQCDAAPVQWANYVASSGSLLFNPTDGGAVYFRHKSQVYVLTLSDDGAAYVMYSGDPNFWGMMITTGDDHWHLGWGSDEETVAGKALTWSDSGVGINKVSSIGAQLHVVSSDNAKVTVIFDSAASPTADIVEIKRAGTTVANWTANGHMVLKELSTNPDNTVLANGDQFAIYKKNDKLVFAFNSGGTINYLSIPLDGASTSWVQGTTAP